MKPTLDEEIRRIAEEAKSNVLDAMLDPDAPEENEVTIVESAIRAGIEAWKRQEPSDEMLDDGANAYFQAKGIAERVPLGFLLTVAYRAMMLASLRTTKGE